MESQPQNPEFRNNPENFHPCNSPFRHVQMKEKSILLSNFRRYLQLAIGY